MTGFLNLLLQESMQTSIFTPTIPFYVLLSVLGYDKLDRRQTRLWFGLSLFYI